MRKALFLLMIFGISLSTFSQNNKTNRIDSERIKKDTCYYWFQGNPDYETMDDAEDDAVKGLLEKVKKNYKSNIMQVGSDNERLLDCVFDSFKPYIEQNVQFLTLKSGNLNEVFAYLSKASFREACAERKSDIDYYVRMADIAMQKENVGDALRYYYIALMLCYSHPYGANLLINNEETGETEKLGKWLYNQIDGDDGILNNVRFIVKNWNETDENTDVELYISTMSGIAVSNISFKYHNGKFQQVENVSNGKAIIQVAKESEKSLKDIDVEIDMSYPDIEFEEPVAFSMMKFVKRRVDFGKTDKKISAHKIKSDSNDKTNSKHETSEANETSEISNSGNSISKYEVTDGIFINKIRYVESAIRNNDYESVLNLFSDEGYEMFMKLKNYGVASVIGIPDYKLFIFNDEVICRSIPMRFGFNKTAFTRDVIFRFNKETKLITSLAFRLSDTAEKCIWDRDDWKIDSRLVLINFLEDYQTAYAFKQLDYLDKIFSDNALIIVGHVVENKPLTENDIVYGKNQKVERTLKTKAEYMESLGRHFRTKSYINIHFTDLDVRRAARQDEEVFGVQVRQYYYSNNYNDEGYLFLMVDLRQELPIIHVRTWQPGKTDIEDLITLRDVL